MRIVSDANNARELPDAEYLTRAICAQPGELSPTRQAPAWSQKVPGLLESNGGVDRSWAAGVCVMEVKVPDT